MAYIPENRGTYDEYRRRVDAIVERTRELGWAIADSSLRVEVDSATLSLARTSHTVWVSDGVHIEAAVLSKEEFLNVYGLFERGAVPKLRAAVERLAVRPMGPMFYSRSGEALAHA